MGGGLISSSGELILTLTGVGSESGDFEGSAPAFFGIGFVDIVLNRVLVLTPFAGYRYAKIKDVTINGIPIYAFDGSPYEVDYSGLAAGLKLKLCFPGSAGG